MNIALILAGGSGERMHSDIPKQFLVVNGTPVIIYTMLVFQEHPDIDHIIVVCLDGWQAKLQNYVMQYGITKLQRIVSGGKTVQESIRNGVYYLEANFHAEDIVVIHDAVRPLIETSVLSDAITKCRQFGNAVSALSYNEQLFITDDGICATEYIPRERLRRVVTPQAYKLGKLAERYHEAYRLGIGIHASAYANTMMAELGECLYFSAGSEKNIKLTTEEDVDIFQALLMTWKRPDSGKEDEANGTVRK